MKDYLSNALISISIVLGFRLFFVLMPMPIESPSTGFRLFYLIMKNCKVIHNWLELLQCESTVWQYIDDKEKIITLQEGELGRLKEELKWLKKESASLGTK